MQEDKEEARKLLKSQTADLAVAWSAHGVTVMVVQYQSEQEQQLQL